MKKKWIEPKIDELDISSTQHSNTPGSNYVEYNGEIENLRYSWFASGMASETNS